MPARLTLEAFDMRPEQADTTAEPPGSALEDMRLAAYEMGYEAGWEDAVAAHVSGQAQIREALAQNLRDLSFTYHEARTQLLRAIEPLFRVIADRVLPETARATVGAHVAAELASRAAELAHVRVGLVVAPDDRPAIEAALPEVAGLDVAIVEDPMLLPGQVHFRLGPEERTLDLAALVTAIGRLIEDFLDTPQERRAANG